MPGITEYEDFPLELVNELHTSYNALEQIGEGGFGVVFSGVNKENNKTLVLKVVNLKEDSHRAQFKQEVKLTKVLSKHPNICQVYSAKKRSYKQNRQCLKTTYGIYTMEKMDCDLLDYILANPLGSSKTKLQSIFKSICQGVEYCHSKGIAHLDLKPDNVLLKLKGQRISDIKLCDFGSAKKAQLKNGGFVPEVTNGKFGTCQYLPPECMEQYDPFSPIRYDKVDIYSLGVMLYVLSTNTFPKLYSEDGDKKLLLENDFERLKSISEECYELVTSMMNENAFLRPSIKAVLAHPFFRRV